MNKIEELENRIQTIEKLLGINLDIEPSVNSFYEHGYYETSDITRRDITYLCRHNHLHDNLLEAKSCSEKDLA